jgi:NADPH-dependent ferric siderophore reductase
MSFQSRESQVAGRPGSPGGGGRRRLPPVLVEVVSSEKLTPRLVSVRVTAPDLSRFAQAAPTSHIKLFLPAPGQDAPTMPTVGPDGERVWPEDQPRPTVRTYTPRAYDADTNTLEIQFVLHGVGPASEWAERVAIGDKLAIGGPGGRFAADLETPHWWIVGDESALPAIATLLDALPNSVSAEVHVEVDGADDEIPLTSAAGLELTWHHRQNPQAWGASLTALASGATIAADTQVWAACEASAVRQIRRTMFEQHKVSPSLLITRGYWRLGEADHPDHDYGED